MEDWEKEFALEYEKDSKSIKAVEWGKLGGRPKKEVVKSERITLRFTPKEMAEIKLKSEISKLNTTQYCRLILIEKELPDIEQNKLLSTYVNNFARISNYMKMGIFNDNSKEELLTEIRNLIAEIRNKIQWL